MQRSLSRGFTILELLIVLAIIGILTVISLDYIGESKEKGADSGALQNMSNARSQAEVYFVDNNRSYVGLCDVAESLGIFRHMQAAARAQNVIPRAVYANTDVGTLTPPQEACHTTVSAYAAWFPLANGRAVCIDSLNNTRTYSTGQLASGATVCP